MLEGVLRNFVIFRAVTQELVTGLRRTLDTVLGRRLGTSVAGSEPIKSGRREAIADFEIRLTGTSFVI